MRSILKLELLYFSYPFCLAQGRLEVELNTATNTCGFCTLRPDVCIWRKYFDDACRAMDMREESERWDILDGKTNVRMALRVKGKTRLEA